MNRRRRRKSQCPICNTSVQRKGNRFYPFCSERCKLVDLGNWLDEKYVIPGSEPPNLSPPPPEEN